MRIKINTTAMEKTREANAWSVTETARRIGISDRAYRAIVSGQVATPNQKTRRGIAEAFGVEVAQVIGFQSWE